MAKLFCREELPYSQGRTMAKLFPSNAYPFPFRAYEHIFHILSQGVVEGGLGGPRLLIVLECRLPKSKKGPLGKNLKQAPSVFPIKCIFFSPGAGKVFS